MKYFEVSVSTNHAVSEFVASVLTDFGCEGVATYDKQDLLDLIESGNTWDYIEENLMEQDGSVVIVKGFFTKAIDMGELTAAINELRRYNDNCGSLETTSQWLDDADYANEWKKYYQTIKLDKIAIVPRWLPQEPDRINVLIDPGAAFGTGSHETTSMCLKLLETLNLTGKTVTDLGCGSGILAMAALKLGAKKAMLIDIDESAIRVSRENVALNELTERAEFSCGNILDMQTVCDIMIANITADILVMLSGGLREHILSGGSLILSGIIDREYARVEQTFRHLGYTVERHLQDGDWHSLILGA